MDLENDEDMQFRITFGPKKIFGEEFSYENYFFLFVNYERAK